jgi:hypothetical protein
MDLTPEGGAVAVVRVGDTLRVVMPDWDLGTPAPVRFPRVRALNSDQVLLAETRTEHDAPNAWILDRRRGVVAHFLMGDAIADIVVSPPFIAVTYFDEAYGSAGPAGEGASFFDFDGHFVWGYRAQFGHEAVDMMDVYAACADETGCLWFYPYTDFPLVRLDIHAREQQIFEPPETLHGAHALSIRNGNAYFIGPYERHGLVFEWPLKAPDARRLGTLEARVRGLPGGRFLAGIDGTWAVVDDLSARGE